MDYLGEHKIEHEGNRYIVTAEEAKWLEKEHITESVYCNEFKFCSMSWFYSSIGDDIGKGNSWSCEWKSGSVV